MKNYPLRYQAIFTIEAKTPLAVGSGDKDILLDNPIIRDAFDLPYIPATSLTGVMRHTLLNFSIDKKAIDCLFGYQTPNSDEGAGSRIILSSAHLLAAGNKVADGLEQALALQEELEDLLILPQREHARINHRGVADEKNHGKFESQLLARGTRFVFEMELWGNIEDEENWNKILQIIGHPLFRIGSGTRKGFGELMVVDCWYRKLDLETEKGMNLYLDKTTQIQLPTDVSFEKHIINDKQTTEKLIHYQLNLNARDFFLFDGQFEMDLSEIKLTKYTDKNGVEKEKLEQKLADMTPKVEQMIEWVDDTPKPSEYKWLIPATSVKGAIAHRVAFHYNKETKKYANPSKDLMEEVNNFINSYPTPKNEDEAKAQKAKISDYLKKLSPDGIFDDLVGEKNAAVKTLFGEKADEKEERGQRGKVLFSDVYISKSKEEKVLNHVKIDRYTGGGIDSALFSEKIAHTKEEICLDIYVETSAFEDDKDIEKAFEQTLKDLATEQLPLGGGVMRGHGMMKGTITKNGQVL